MTSVRYLIGLDVSIQTGNNGFAIYDCRKKQYIAIRSMGYKSVVGEISDFLNEYCTKTDDGKEWADVAVVLENADLDSPVFGAWKEFEAQLKNQFKSNFPNWNALGSSFSSMMTKAQNIGMQKMVARDIFEGLKMLKVKIIQVAPSWRERADVMKNKAGLTTSDVTYYIMPTKTNKEQFLKLTGYKGTTNEHERDACTLVWNQTYERLKVWSETMMLQVTAQEKKKEARKKAAGKKTVIRKPKKN